MSQQDVMFETRSENKTDALQRWRKHASDRTSPQFWESLDFTMSNGNSEVSVSTS